MRRLGRLILKVLVGLLVLALVLAVVVRFITYHPEDVEEVPVWCDGSPGLLRAGQRLKVLSWNVQYMAGKGYVFFYDLLDGSGPDERPSREAIELTLAGVARVLAEEDPDVVLLQEVDDGASRTDGEDQLARLLALLPPGDRCHASAFYWKASFVPHPRVMGAVGLKLSVISRYRIEGATRHQLPRMPDDLVTRQFALKRALLDVRLPIEGGGASALAVLNTHLDAFAQGSDTMQRQVAQVRAHLEGLEAAGVPWVLAGDFNLLPSRASYDRLAPEQRAYYQPDSELAPLLAGYRSVPSPAEADGPDAAAWTTHFPNDPQVSGPDRTIDFVLLSDGLALGEHHVRHAGALTLSDHLPVVASLDLPGAR